MRTQPAAALLTRSVTVRVPHRTHCGTHRRTERTRNDIRGVSRTAACTAVCDRYPSDGTLFPPRQAPGDFNTEEMTKNILKLAADANL